MFVYNNTVSANIGVFHTTVCKLTIVWFMFGVFELIGFGRQSGSFYFSALIGVCFRRSQTNLYYYYFERVRTHSFNCNINSIEWTQIFRWMHC